MRKYTINTVKTERYTSSKNKGKKSQNKNLIFSNPESVLDNGENKINISDMRQQSQAKNISIQNNLNKKIKNHTFYESKYRKRATGSTIVPGRSWKEGPLRNSPMNFLTRL